MESEPWLPLTKEEKVRLSNYALFSSVDQKSFIEG